MTWRRTPVLLMDEPFGALDAMSRDVRHEELERSGHDWADRDLRDPNVREAVRLGDPVVVLQPRPGRVLATDPVDLPRPRRIDAPEVAALAARITDRLREEVPARVPAGA